MQQCNIIQAYSRFIQAPSEKSGITKTDYWTDIIVQAILSDMPEKNGVAECVDVPPGKRHPDV